jgi:DNA-binding transcriptional ArsR family regulator
MRTGGEEVRSADEREARDVDVVIDILRALGYSARLRVILRLERGSATPAELAVVAGVAQSVMSHHLRHLRAAGLVQRFQQDGRARVGLAEGVGELIDAVFACGARIQRRSDDGMRTS